MPTPQSIEALEQEIEHVALLFKQVVFDTIFPFKARKHKWIYIRDETLKAKCDASRRAWKQWKINGRLRDGDMYKAAKLDLKHYVSERVVREILSRSICSHVQFGNNYDLQKCKKDILNTGRQGTCHGSSMRIF